MPPAPLQAAGAAIWERWQCPRQVQAVLCQQGAAVAAQTCPVPQQAPVLRQDSAIPCEQGLAAVLWAELQGRHRAAAAQAWAGVERCQVLTAARSALSHG